MNSRPSLDEYLMSLAIDASKRTTCIRRGVGCVLANERGHVLAIGYNGVASGLPHCNEKRVSLTRGPASTLGTFPHACVGHGLPPGQDSCEAVHAEQNALLQCRDPWEVRTAYVTLSPCKACLKLLLNTGCQRIVVLKEHVGLMPKELWARVGRAWEVFDRRALPTEPL